MPSRRWLPVVALVVMMTGGAALYAFGRDDATTPDRASKRPVAKPVANLWIDGAGRRCRRSPTPVGYRRTRACRTFSAAYEAARQGDTVLVRKGTYREPELTGSVKGDPNADEADVTFAAAPGATVRVHDIEILVPHITFRRIDLLEAGVKYRSDYDAHQAGDITIVHSDGHSMTINSAWNVTLRDSDLGPQRHPGQTGDDTADALYVGGYPPDDGHHVKNLTIDRVRFHDVVRPTRSAHSDCLQITAGENVRVMRSTFFNCADADIIPKNDQGPIRNLLVENSALNEVVNDSEEINFFDTGRPCGDVTFRNNSVIGTIRIDGGEDDTDCNLQVVGNITASMAPHRCSASQADVLTHNVWEEGVRCGRSNVVVRDGDVGYRNRSNGPRMDLRLRQDSEAIDRGDQTNHPPVDYAGRRRDADEPPDAGAFESG
jgi:hypothetical protein